VPTIASFLLSVVTMADHYNTEQTKVLYALLTVCFHPA
jgi:hypothetical protein